MFRSNLPKQDKCGSLDTEKGYGFKGWDIILNLFFYKSNNGINV